MARDLAALNDMLRRANLPNIVTQTPRRTGSQ
jgi:hypothetical protein